jgi:hypothetical protein
VPQSEAVELAVVAGLVDIAVVATELPTERELENLSVAAVVEVVAVVAVAFAAVVPVAEVVVAAAAAAEPPVEFAEAVETGVTKEPESRNLFFAAPAPEHAHQE